MTFLFLNKSFLSNGGQNMKHSFVKLQNLKH